MCAGGLLGQKGETPSRISHRYACFDLPIRYTIDISSIISVDCGYVVREWLLSGPHEVQVLASVIVPRTKLVSEIRAWCVARLPRIDRPLISIELSRRAADYLATNSPIGGTVSLPRYLRFAGLRLLV